MFSFRKKKKTVERSSFEEAPAPGNERMIGGQFQTGSSNNVIVEVAEFNGNAVKSATFGCSPESNIFVYINGETYQPKGSFDMSKVADVKKLFDTIPIGHTFPDSITIVKMHSSGISKIVVPYSVFENVGDMKKQIDGSCLLYAKFGENWNVGSFIEFTKNNGEVNDHGNGHIEYTLTMKKLIIGMLTDIITNRVGTADGVEQSGLQVHVNGDAGQQDIRELLINEIKSNPVFAAYNIVPLDVEVISKLSEEDRLKIEEYKMHIDQKRRTMMSQFKKKDAELDLEEMRNQIKIEKKKEELYEKTEKDD